MSPDVLAPWVARALTTMLLDTEVKRVLVIDKAGYQPPASSQCCESETQIDFYVSQNTFRTRSMNGWSYSTGTVGECSRWLGSDSI